MSRENERIGLGRLSLMLGLFVAAGIPPASAIDHASDRLVYQEDFEGESDYPTTPEIDELFSLGLFGDSMPGGGSGPVLTGSAARASVSTSGAELQGVLLLGNELGSNPTRFRGLFSSLSVAPDSEAIVFLNAEFEATAGTTTLEAAVIAGSDLSGTIVDGTIEIRQQPAIGSPTSLFAPLSPAALSALDSGAPFTIDLEVERDLAVADATLSISGLPDQPIGSLATDPTMAGMGVGLLVQALGLGAGGDTAPVEVDFDGFEIYRLFSTSFTVDSLADGVDALPGDGSCATSNGHCSLRAAVQESNSSAGQGEIIVPPGRYLLSIAGTLEDATATGDLDILDDLHIRGAGRNSTIVDAGGIDRVFHIPVDSFDVMAQLMELEITNGAAVISGSARGGGVESGGRLDLIRCLVSNNQANQGAGVFSRRRLNMDDCVVRDNEALDLGFASARAGGVTGGSTSIGTGPETISLILNSSIVNNISPLVGGLELGNAFWAVVQNTTISGNSNAQVLVRSTDTLLKHVTIESDLGAGILASSFDSNVPLEFANTAIEGLPACNLNTVAPMDWLYSGQNASNDTSCGFAAPGDITGVPLGLAPLVEAGNTFFHLPEPGSPLIDSADTVECAVQDQRGGHRPTDGDASGTAECDLGAIEVPEPGLGVSILCGILWMGLGSSRSSPSRRSRPSRGHGEITRGA